MRGRKVSLLQHCVCADVIRWRIYLQIHLSLHILHVGLLELNFGVTKIGRCWDPHCFCQRPTGNVSCAVPLSGVSRRIAREEVEVDEINFSRLGDMRVYGAFVKAQAPVVQRLDNAIHRINRYPADKCYKANHAIHWIVIYPADSVIHFFNNRDLANK